VINNVFTKRKTKRGKSNVNKHDHLWEVISREQFSGKSEPVGMIDNPHQQAAFTIGMTRDRVQESLGQFLDEDDVKVGVCFKDCADNEIVFLDILRKNLKVFQNHRLFVFPVE